MIRYEEIPTTGGFVKEGAHLVAVSQNSIHKHVSLEEHSGCPPVGESVAENSEFSQL